MLAYRSCPGPAPSAEVTTTDIGIQRVDRAVVFVITRLSARWLPTLIRGRHRARRGQRRARLMRHYLQGTTWPVMLAPTSLSGRVTTRPAATHLISGAPTPHRLSPAEPGALTRAEHPPTVAAGTHPHADPASSTLVHPNEPLAHARASPTALDSTGEGEHKDRAEALPKRCRGGEGPGLGVVSWSRAFADLVAPKHRPVPVVN